MIQCVFVDQFGFEDISGNGGCLVIGCVDIIDNCQIGFGQCFVDYWYCGFVCDVQFIYMFGGNFGIGQGFVQLWVVVVYDDR